MKDGYLIIHGVEEALLKKVWMDLHYLVVKQLERFRVNITADMKTNLEALLNVNVESYVATLGVASRLKSVFDLFSAFFNAGVYSVPSMPVLHVMGVKVPGGYSETSPHQDWASTQGSLDTKTVWVPLTNTLGNFPLEVIPNSHSLGIMDGKLNGSVLEVDCDGEFLPLDAGFGDAVIMSSFLVHRTGGGGGLRIAVSMRYENVNEPTFIERGYPCAQKRIVDREIKWKPTREQVRHVA